MTRVALALVGGLIGFAGSQFLVQPVSAFLGPATVVWSAANCPAGLYSVYSFVRGSNGNFIDSATVTNVELPKATFTQQFSNLPAGTLQAGAMAFISGGAAFRAETQTIHGTGGEDDRAGRTRLPTTPSIGFARARTAAPPPPPTEPRSTASSSALAPVGSTQDLALSRVLRQLNVPLDAGDAANWRQFLVEDTDGDGAADVVTIESETGSLFVIRLDSKSRVLR